mmetsp:Transcript_29569/g.70438  ORF Transcript_29569/g.70438 Transcript_29569/m.70438 type:complete len:118 (+) Transcript_29569:282-635(+)
MIEASNSSVGAVSPQPQYSEIEKGYGVKQTRFADRPGGYGWKVNDDPVARDAVGPPAKRFGASTRPLASLVATEHTLLPPKQEMDCFVSLPGNHLNARNEVQPPFATYRHAWGGGRR